MTLNKLHITIILMFFIILCSYYVIDMIKKLELHLLVDRILFKIELGHIQISVPKIGTPMLKTACINPWMLRLLLQYCVYYRKAFGEVKSH